MAATPDQPQDDTTTLASTPPPQQRGGSLNPGDRVGHFTIRQFIAKGGFGEVYQAEQSEPIRRTVALKLIIKGLDTDQVVNRFAAERQALALMDHPCVARVYEGGVTPDGRPYFAMEFVKGSPLSEHCDRHRLSIEERLALFIRICEAIQHAHNKGIVHRDLKPNNILVEYEAGVRTPKVIDFGIAKALHQKLTDRTIFTQAEAFMGTPVYMSPEQAEMSGEDIDTRSDVYSLGVILYELLTGMLPFDSAALRGASNEAIRRLIREVDPPRPSTRMTTRSGTRGPDDDPERAAALRSTETHSLATTLRRDLDWVVMKCLEKNRERRYETASSLAEDIRRYLRHEPVIASPPSVSYRFSKYVRRHRVGVAMGGVIAATLVAAAAISTWFAIEAERAREKVADALQAEEARATELESVVQFQEDQLKTLDPEVMGEGIRTDLIEDLKSRAKHFGASQEAQHAWLSHATAAVQGADFTGLSVKTLKSQIFDPMRAAINTQYADLPLVKARMLMALFEIQAEVGDWADLEEIAREAVAIHRERLGEDHPDALRALYNLAATSERMGRFAEAETQFQDLLERRRRVLGENDADTLLTRCRVAELLLSRQPAEAEAMLREVLERNRIVLGEDHPGTLSTTASLASALRKQGRFSESEVLLRGLLEQCRRVLGEGHPETLRVADQLANMLFVQGKNAEAAMMLQDTLNLSIRTLGKDHPYTLDTLAQHCSLLRLQGLGEEAWAQSREVFDRRRRVLGEDHPDTLRAQSVWAWCLSEQGSYEEAEAQLRDVLDRRSRVLAADRFIDGARYMLALVLENRGRHVDAEAQFREALAEHAEDHRGSLAALDGIARSLSLQGRHAEAEAQYRDLFERSRRVIGEDEPLTLYTLHDIAKELTAQGRYAEAEAQFRDVLERQRAALGDDHPYTEMTVAALARLREHQSQDSGQGFERETPGKEPGSSNTPD